MKKETLIRPVITEFVGDGFELNKAHKMYLNNLELWNYIQALDKYCDYLENKLCEGKTATERDLCIDCDGLTAKQGTDGLFRPCNCQYSK